MTKSLVDVFVCLVIYCVNTVLRVLTYIIIQMFCDRRSEVEKNINYVITVLLITF